jgi:hypothetical protein
MTNTFGRLADWNPPANRRDPCSSTLSTSTKPIRQPLGGNSMVWRHFRDWKCSVVLEELNQPD